MTKLGPANSTDLLRSAIESVADQLCVAVDGNFEFRVKVNEADPSIEKLQMLINFVLDAARRSVHEQQILNDELRVAMAQVQDSCRRAEAANKAKSDFLANMSHELRTPLTAILGFTDVLRESASDAQQEKLGTIKRNGDQLLTIVNDVLDLSKVESGEVQIIIGNTEIVPLLLEVTNGFVSEAQKKQIDLICSTRSPIPECLSTDTLRVRQVLANLVSNAIKFTSHGWVHLEASVKKAPANMLHIDVIDTGIGIAEQDRENIFAPFTQADNSATRKFGGTGMGLTISKRFAQLLGGDVTLIDTRRGSGTHFRLALPCQVDAKTRMVEIDQNTYESKIAPASPASPSNTKPLDQLAILLVEDGPDNQRLINHILSKNGATVTTADNGKLAIDAVQKSTSRGHNFDIVLMDMQMPVMDGYTATKILRSMGTTTPILALTAHAITGDREKCLNAGCSDYVTKPINSRELVELTAALAAAHKPNSINV